jgi:hypothetical protein
VGSYKEGNKSIEYILLIEELSKEAVYKVYKVKES